MKNTTPNPLIKGIEKVTPQVLQALREGDHDAFKTIYFVYLPQILTFLKYFTRSETEAEELTQEVFTKIWEKRAQIDLSKTFGGYLFTIARNAALQYWRSLNNKAVVSSDKYEEYISDDYTTDSQIIRTETELLVKIAVSRMPNMQRKVFEMSVMEEKSTEEISRELNISSSTVFSYLSTARRQIREFIALVIIIFIN